MYGLTFKGLHSSQFGLICKSDNRQALPSVTRFTKQVPGYHGVIDFGQDTYSEKQIVVTLQYNYHHNHIQLWQQMELVSGWLYDDGQYYDLIFDDQPDRKFRAKVASQVDISPDKQIIAVQVTFTANPPWAYMLDNTPVSPADVQRRLLWDTALLDGIQYYQNFTANGAMRFTVGGVQPVKPVIKIFGTIPTGFTMTYGSAVWSLLTGVVNDGIIIDCNAQTVVRASDGSSLISYVNPVKDDFFTLQTGQQQITVTGVQGAFPYDLSIMIEFTPIGG